jgi:hypothetical protein
VLRIGIAGYVLGTRSNTLLASIAEQLIDGVDGAADDPLDGAHRGTFTEQGENMGALRSGSPYQA